MSDRPVGETVDQEFRRLVSDIATVPGPTPELHELQSPVLTFEGERTMNTGVKYGFIAAAAAVVAIIVGLAIVIDGDDGGIETIEPPEESTTVVPTTAAPTSSTAAPDEVAVAFVEKFSLDPADNQWLEAFAPDVRFVGPELPIIGVFTSENLQALRFSYTLNPDYRGPDCDAGRTDAGGDLVVTCIDTYEQWDNLALPGAPTQSVSTMLRIGPDGIREVDQRTETSPVGSNVASAYERWLAAFHPGEEAYAILFATDLVAVSDVMDLFEVRTTEWATYNEKYGCTVDNWDRCGPAAIADSLVRAWARKDLEVVDALLGSEYIAGALDLERALGFTTVPRCTASSPLDAESGSIECRGTLTTTAMRALDPSPEETVLFRLTVSVSNQITEFERIPSQPPGYVEMFETFIEWLGANNPDDLGSMIDGDGNPITTPEALELWEKYTEEFVAAQG